MKNPNEVKTKSIFHFVPTRSARAPPPVACRARRTPAERARAPSRLTEPKRETRRRRKPGASLHRGRGQSRSAGRLVGSQTALVTRGLQAEAMAAPGQLLGLRQPQQRGRRWVGPGRAGVRRPPRAGSCPPALQLSRGTGREGGAILRDTGGLVRWVTPMPWRGLPSRRPGISSAPWAEGPATRCRVS